MNEIIKKDLGAKFIADALSKNGYCAYLVGGCVRDAIMGEVPADIDITSSATPDTAMRILRDTGCTIAETGLKHGTFTAIYKGVPYEITTMRTESGYNDSRHPENVEFVKNIEQDLSRRDFTINAMAYSYENDEVIDVFGGKEDIKAKIVRCVGEPQRRFEEDALRIMRALRFASRLGFDIEKNTLEAMKNTKANLLNISSERIYKELCSILCGKHAGRVMMAYSDILYPVIPELEACNGFSQHSRYHKYDVLEHTCKVIDEIPPIPALRLAALFHDVGKPSVFSLDENGEGHFFGHAHKSTEIAEKTLKNLKADNKTKEDVLFLVKHHDTPLPSEEILLKKRLNRIGTERFLSLCAIARADCLGQDDSVRYRLGEIEKIKDAAERIIGEGTCFSLSSLAVDGNDVMSFGVKEGRDVGRVLSCLLDEVLSGQIENTSEKLKKRIRELVDIIHGNKQ